MTTIVSAFLSNVNNNRSTEKYIEYGRKLLAAPVPKVIFIEKQIVEENNLKEDELTKFVFIDKNALWLRHHYKHILYYPITDNPKKDTVDYFATMCNKTEWIREAINLNLFNTENFIWCDFGISYTQTKDLSDKLIRMCNQKYDKIRIAGIWEAEIWERIKRAGMENMIYKRISWFFAGGVFGGPKNLLLQFADLMVGKCLEVIGKKHTLMWEVNIWHLIYLEHKEIFDVYKADHNDTLMDNY